jgi:hypothetical protein
MVAASRLGPPPRPGSAPVVDLDLLLAERA